MYISFKRMMELNDPVVRMWPKIPSTVVGDWVLYVV